MLNYNQRNGLEDSEVKSHGPEQNPENIFSVLDNELEKN
jgi:hypothetical protein